MGNDIALHIWNWIKGVLPGAPLVARKGKNPPASVGDLGSVPELGRSPGGDGNPLQYPCLANPVDGGAWQSTVHGVLKSQTRPNQLNSNNNTDLWQTGSIGAGRDPNSCLSISAVQSPSSDHTYLQFCALRGLGHNDTNLPVSQKLLEAVMEMDRRG